MAINIDNHSLKMATTEKRVQLLPCHIEYSGETNVDKYFTNCIHENKDGGM